VLHVAGEQADERPAVGFVGLQRREQLFDPGIELGCLRGLRELGSEQIDIAPAHRGDSVVRAELRVSCQFQELAHDLRIGLAIEAVAVDWAGGPHLVQQRLMNGAPSCTVCPQEGSVDVEKD